MTTPLGSATSTSNFTVSTSHSRGVTLKLKGHLVARGWSAQATGSPHAPRAFPSRTSARPVLDWKNVGSKTTDASGYYKKRIKDKPGKYRAKAPKVTLNAGADICSSDLTRTKEQLRN